MLNKVTTENSTFIYDTDTITPWHSHIRRCTFIRLKCYKVITEKGASYQYPDFMFLNQNMCNDDQIISEQKANSVEKDIFKLIQTNQKLGKDNQKLLREKYLEIIDNKDK